MLRVMEDLGMNSAMVNLNNSMTKAGWFYYLITGRFSVTRLENFGLSFISSHTSIGALQS
jgi:hypothetical protein